MSILSKGKEIVSAFLRQLCLKYRLGYLKHVELQLELNCLRSAKRDYTVEKIYIERDAEEKKFKGV